MGNGEWGMEGCILIACAFDNQLRVFRKVSMHHYYQTIP